MASGNEPSLDRELQDALEGVNLQEVDLSPARGGAGGSGGPPGPGAKSDRLQRGTIVGINGDDVIVELGPRSQGVIAATEFDPPAQIGEEYEFSLAGEEDGLWLLSRKEAMMLAAWNELAVGALAKAQVTGQNSGGLELKVGKLSAFMPASHVALSHVEDLSTFVGESFVCEVIELDPSRKRVTLSRRRVLEREREEKRREVADTLVPGRVVRGKVSRLESFGAFVDIGGVEGLVHVSNVSRKRVEDITEVLKVGQEVEAQILQVTEGGKRIGLGMKQLEPDPWDTVRERYREDSMVSGKVTRLAAFGAFVELEPGLEGLLHISQIGGGQRIRRVDQVLKVGEEVAVRLVSIDERERRLSLSRLDSRGSLIGSEDAAEASEIERVIDEHSGSSATTNLGNLFKKALGGDS